MSVSALFCAVVICEREWELLFQGPALRTFCLRTCSSDGKATAMQTRDACLRRRMGLKLVTLDFVQSLELICLMEKSRNHIVVRVTTKMTYTVP